MSSVNTKLIFSALILTLNGLFAESGIIERCKERCDQVNDPAEVDDFKCNSTCSLHQCKEGCNLFIEGRTEGCATKCGTSQNTFRVQQCTVGCNIAVDLYAEDIMQMFSGWTAPELAANSLRNTSLALDWKNIKITHLKYSLQIKELVRGKTGWKNHDRFRWRGSSKIKVFGLHPFVTYQFRIFSKITERHTVSSPASVSISTLPYGAPVSAPEIVSVTSSATSIHLRWKVPVYINGPLLSYRITIDRLDQTDIPKMKDTLADPDVEEVSDVITMLDEQTSYIVTIVAVNQFGAGPSVKTNATTPARDTKPGITPYLIFGSRNMILKQDLNDLHKLPEYTYENEDPISGTGLPPLKPRVSVITTNIKDTYVINERKKQEAMDG